MRISKKLAASPKTKNDNGYTLVELLVTVSIYALAFTAISAIFLGYSTAQSRAVVAQRLLSEGNHIFEQVAREIRINALEYECSGADYSFETDYLCLKTYEGRQVRFRITGGTQNKQVEICKMTTLASCGTSDWRALTPSTLNVTDFKFHVFPDDNPQNGTVEGDFYHPLVVLEASMEAGSGKKRQTYDFQTVISSRAYAF